VQTHCHTTSSKPPGAAFWVSILLMLSTVTVYGQVYRHEFISLDDPGYITDNPHVKAGLTSDGIFWALTNVDAANWHPLTWISHMVDVSLFGMNPGLHHLVNLVFHILNTLLLFWALYQMTGNLWPSGIVAAWFGLHPLHVESVAWVSERKDVLSAFFWMLTLLAYARYAKRPRLAGYLTVVLAFLLGLLSKPMLVTLPFVLLLLDYWPLARFTSGNTRVGARARVLIKEKIPLIGMSAAASAATWIAQSSKNAIYPLDMYPMTIRIGNAAIAYVHYIWKTFWPFHLSGFYPHPREALPVWAAAGSALILLLITVWAFRSIQRHPFLFVGWCWYSGTLVPVIGLVQVGAQAMADRYTYIPLIGLFVMLAWGGPKLLETVSARPVYKPLVVSASLIVGIGLMTVTWRQAGHWRSSRTFYQHMLRITPDNYVGCNGLGRVLEREGNRTEAIRLYSEAVRILPNYARARLNLANAYAAEGGLHPAIEQYRKVLTITPDDREAMNNLGIALVKTRDYDAAIDQFGAVLERNPMDLKVFINLGVARFHTGDYPAAEGVFRYVLSRASGSQTDAVRLLASRNLKIMEAVRQNLRKEGENGNGRPKQRPELSADISDQ